MPRYDGPARLYKPERKFMVQKDSLTVVDNLPFVLDEGTLLQRFHLTADSVFVDGALRFAREAAALARPKGLYKVAAVEPAGDDTVLLDGILFTSRILRVNLDGRHRAFPFLATCGRELDDWGRALEDPMELFWADALKELALEAAAQALGAHLAGKYQPGEQAAMNPGSLRDWPIHEQRALFSLFGDGAAAIGVTLNDSFLMSPVKSISGLWFQTDVGFVNCQLCPREECPNRRIPHDPHLFERRYGPPGANGGH